MAAELSGLLVAIEQNPFDVGAPKIGGPELPEGNLGLAREASQPTNIAGWVANSACSAYPGSPDDSFKTAMAV